MISSDLITRSKPISEQVRNLLRARIQQGTYPADERMPSEERLAQELDVSRSTVRTALAALAAEGLVRRRHGDGTYPTANVIEISVRRYDAWNIERQIQQSGRTPSTQVLEHGLRPPSPRESENLSLGDFDQVFSIRRVFFADDLPVLLADYVIRYEAGLPEPSAELVQLHLLEFLYRYYRHPLHSGHVLFKAIPADDDTAQTLNIAPGSPVLFSEALVVDNRDLPLLLAREFYRGEEGCLLPLAPFPG